MAFTILWGLGFLAHFLPAAAAQTTQLDRFVGRDFWAVVASENELPDLLELAGKVPKGFVVAPEPWRFWKATGVGQAQYIFLLGESLVLIPGGSSVCVQTFDGSAKRINSWSFQTGWRIALTGASIQYSNEIASDLIAIHTVPIVNGLNIAKEYFAIGGNRLRLIRLENDKGEPVQNEYALPNYEIGVVPEAHTVEEWAGLLESKDKADVLSALVFLGGRHIDVGPWPSESKYAGLWRQLTGSRRIRESIELLSRSGSDWIRQAAVSAARGPHPRLFE